MKILNGNELDLQGSHGEAITLTVESNDEGGPAFAANLNQAAFFGSSFILDENVADPFVLVIKIFFKSDSGGNYKATLSSSKGGGPAIHSVTQHQGQVDNSFAFVLDIQ